ncbi:MAG: hypothetical protein Q9178_003500 [Gyalolechia marmorata]
MDTRRALVENPSIFQSCISALSDLEFNYQASHDLEIYTESGTSVQKHVRMLDAISLLFVYEGLGEVCSTTFVQDIDSATILWAKNTHQAPNQEEQHYLNHLCSMFVGQAPVNDILEHVVKKCWGKVISRISRTAKSFASDSISINHDAKGMTERLQILEARLRLANAISPGQTVLDALANFVTSIGKVTKGSKLSHVCQLIDLAAVLIAKDRSHPDLEPPIFNPVQYRKVDKLSAYSKVITMLHKRCKTSHILKLRLQQVPTPTQQHVEIFIRTQDALNTLHPYLPEDILPIDTQSQLAEHYNRLPITHASPLEKKSILVSQHCEISVAFHMLEIHSKNQIKGPIKIGCSKACCFWCKTYIAGLNEQHPDHPIIIYASHGKRTKGWMLPDAEVKARDSIVELVSTSVEDTFRTVWGLPRKRSDSRSVASEFEDLDTTEEVPRPVYGGPLIPEEI